jgi:hypothetical protein
VIGIDEIPSSAQAMALTGVIKQLPAGAGLLPFAVPKTVVDQIDPGDEWEAHDSGDGEFCYTDPDDGKQYCIEDPGAPQNATRGWLNLNHIFNNAHLGSLDVLNRTFEQSASMDKCPNDPSKLPGLPGYASGLCPYAHPILAGDPDYLNGDFIHGSSGAASVGVQEIYDNFAGQTVYAPVFDRAYLREEMVDTFDPQAASPDGYPNGGGFSSAGGGGGDAYYYHIVGYVAAEIGTEKDNHVVVGTFQEANIAPGAIEVTGYSGTCISALFGVNLWE